MVSKLEKLIARYLDNTNEHEQKLAYSRLLREAETEGVDLDAEISYYRQHSTLDRNAVRVKTLLNALRSGNFDDVEGFRTMKPTNPNYIPDDNTELQAMVKDLRKKLTRAQKSAEQAKQKLAELRKTVKKTPAPKKPQPTTGHNTRTDSSENNAKLPCRCCGKLIHRRSMVRHLRNIHKIF